MEQKQYKIIFNGEHIPPHNVERVKNNLASLFNTSATQLNSLFQDRLVVIKKNLDLTAADRYRDAVERVGGYCIIEAMQESADQSVLNLTAKTEKMVCPKCQTVQQKVPVCNACGTIVEEFKKKINENRVAMIASMNKSGVASGHITQDAISSDNQVQTTNLLDNDQAVKR